MKVSIRARLTLWYIGSITLLLMAMFYFTYGIFSHAIYGSDVTARFDDALRERAGRIAGEIARRSGPFVVPAGRYAGMFGTWIGSDLFLNPACGQLRDFPDRPGGEPLIIIRNDALEGRFIPLSGGAHARLARGETAVETLDNIFPYPLRVVSLLVGDREGNRYVLQVGMSLSHVSTTLGNVLFKAFTVGPFLIILISVMGYHFVRTSFAPVRDMVAAARSITAADLSRRVPAVDSADEVGELAATLNDMIGRIERSFEQARQFSDDVSHELKTPVTVIKGEIEVALRSERSGDEYRALLKSLLEEAEKLGAITENLLFLSRLDSGRVVPGFGLVELDALVMEIFEEFSGQARERGVSLVLDRVDEILVKGEPGLLKRLLANLVQNALKYTQPGGSVELSLENIAGSGEMDGMGAKVTVLDTGIGIPRGDLPRIFDRFYRVDKSRSGKTGGSGLGLTIVKKVLDIHGGHVTVKSRQGSGTAFFIYLP
jgi:heavy metal sensor kinase